MSRIAKNPIAVPKGVEVNIETNAITVKSGNKVLKMDVHPLIRLKYEQDKIFFEITKDLGSDYAMTGTTHSLVKNMVVGVSEGFEKKLLLNGVGFRAAVQGKTLQLNVGFSHPVNFLIPETIVIETPSLTEITVKGIDKQVVGQMAANIRAIRPPEPYKGKGIRYIDEVVSLKEGKKK